MGPRMAYRGLKPQIFRQSGLIARCPNSPCGGPKPRSNFRVLRLVAAPQEPMKIHSEGNCCECQAFLWRQGPPVALMIPTFKTSQSEVQRLCSTSPQPPQLHYCPAGVVVSLLLKPDSVWSRKYFKLLSKSKGLGPKVRIKTRSQTQSFSLLFFLLDWMCSPRCRTYEE